MMSIKSIKGISFRGNTFLSYNLYQSISNNPGQLDI